MTKKIKFKGSEHYIATEELSIAVNAAIHLEKPLLIKGEPGTGKTMLAYEIANVLGKELITWHIKSTTTAQQGLYEYDAVSRLRDSQLGDRDVSQIAQYIKPGKIWEAFDRDESAVLLIDEIDKADIEFPNDLLLELDKMEFYVYELQKTIKAKHRPIVVITSNNEKDLPDPFLRRCLFHYIQFPEEAVMRKIADVHFPALEESLLTQALRIFYLIRDQKGLKKAPSTSELIDWIRLLLNERLLTKDLEKIDLLETLPPYMQALIKNEQDLELIAALKNGGARRW